MLPPPDASTPIRTSTQAYQRRGSPEGHAVRYRVASCDRTGAEDRCGPAHDVRHQRTDLPRRVGLVLIGPFMPWFELDTGFGFE